MKTLLIILLFQTLVFAKHLHLERYYQDIFCMQHHGQTEVVLDDRSRVDCLTDEFAIEVDFASKWAESIGQSLYYAKKTGKRAGVLLIMERPTKDKKYLDRLQFIADDLNITVWTTTR